MKRRTFLELTGLAVANTLVQRAVSAAPALKPANDGPTKEYGSGHFGSWIRDAHQLPAYHYTCSQLTDPLAVLPVDKTWRSPTDHMHQVGNDRLVAIASNYGHLQVRQDEGSPKFLNDHLPEQNRYGGGIGFLADDDGFVLSTYYTGKADSFDRIFGMGYLEKRVAARHYAVNQIIFAPHGDDPVLISQVTVTNHSPRPVSARWVEYWGCQNYQFSYRSLMQSGVLGGEPSAVQRRRDFAARFAHRFEKTGSGLLEKQSFLGRTPEDEQAWQKTQAALHAKPTGFFGGPTPADPPGTSMEDLTPPATFLVSLDAAPDQYATNADHFFAGSIEHPRGMTASLDNSLDAHGPESAFFLERRIPLQPGESRTLYFLYGYLPEGFSIDRLTSKYSAHPRSLWVQSCARWKDTQPLLRVKAHPWIERETMWSHYCLRSGLTRDSFFREHILSQGAGYQYQAGIQCAARDPLQHVLPFIFTDSRITRAVLRYTLKEIQPDGSIPYGIVGDGVPMPCVYHPSDLQLWLLWIASEYVLATRDNDFLHEQLPPYPRQNPRDDDPTILDLLSRSFTHITSTIGVGQHGLLRILNGDWNDSIVYTHLTPEQQSETLQVGESVLNSAMATYVFDYYASMLDISGHHDLAGQSRAKANEQREAVQRQWYKQWYRRAWLSEEIGWVGEKQMWLAPQPWALIGGCVPQDRINALLNTVDTLARKPSPIGAMLQSQPDPTMKDEPGTGTNAGIFAAINGTLVWALASVNGETAWDEWQKNTLARHADIYPDKWFGIWSGPDAYHSIFSKQPGGTGVDFPVLNMHSHAWPLYSAFKLLGAVFTAEGVHFKPLLPLDEFEFNSPLLGFRKTPSGYSGWYAPIKAGHWRIEIVLKDADLGRLSQLRVNNQPRPLQPANGKVTFTGTSTPGTPLTWEITAAPRA